MKVNKAQKSKFVYPDKLYARCKDNNTFDISYVPQNMEAVEYTRTDAFIEKAVDYIANNMRCDGNTLQTKVKFIRDFKKYMEGE